ncbi:hypothetical protein [Niabella beijingensis]|uniref:hypothetical protein n=1 Tax=Niabella beijingensis TaxID=2872700 RepID=UPI001CBE21BF|nr:hypothetical protein [Niabella beijingensis]MBZ4190422.1 hypothetical protein [Niabella beijingensis]
MSVLRSTKESIIWSINLPTVTTIISPLSKNVFPDRAKKYIVECQLDGGGVEVNKEGYYGLVFNLDMSIGRHTSLLLNNLHTFSVWQGKEDGTGGNKQLKGWTSFVRNPNAIGELLRIEVTSDGKRSFFLNNKLVFATTINNLKMDKIAFVVSNNAGLRSYYIKATVIK